MMVCGTSTIGGAGCGTTGMEDGGVAVFRGCAEIRLRIRSELPGRRVGIDESHNQTDTMTKSQFLRMRGGDAHCCRRLS